MKKYLALVLCVLMMIVSVPVVAEEADFLPQLSGSYIELFPAMNAPEYDHVWLEACTEFGGEENAQMLVDMLKSACIGEVYGEEAIAAHEGKPEGEMQFNCFFINGVAKFTVDGNVISGADAEGNEVFSHSYAYQGVDSSLGVDLSVYKTDDENAGEFTYFLFAPDLPNETFHIEFRYGDDLEALGQLLSGKYAYWLAAGIPAENTADYAEKSIRLFCEENLTHDEEIVKEAA